MALVESSGFGDRVSDIWLMDYGLGFDNLLVPIRIGVWDSGVGVQESRSEI